MHYHQLVKAARKGEIFDQNAKIRLKYFDQSIVTNAQPFVLDVHSFHQEDREELLASKQAMIEAGVWKLPFSKVAIEIPCCLEEDKSFNFITLLIATQKEESIHIQIFIQESRKKHWFIAPLDYHPEEFMRIFDTFLVLLATRGVRKELRIGNRVALLNRPVPAIAYTYVYIQEQQDYDPITKTTSLSRLKTRLHLRRGHVRNQPYGPGKLQTKKIFINPCLVGYEDQGIVIQKRIVK